MYVCFTVFQAGVREMCRVCTPGISYDLSLLSYVRPSKRPSDALKELWTVTVLTPDILYRCNVFILCVIAFVALWLGSWT